MIKVTHIQKTVRLLAAFIYIALQSAGAVHAVSHDVDTPADNSCTLCKFADSAPALAPEDGCGVLPQDDVIADIIPLDSGVFGVLSSYQAIRGPPSVS